MVPFYADLSHWHAAETGKVFIPSKTEGEAEDSDLFQLHHALHVGCWSAHANFHRIRYRDGVEETISVQDGVYRNRISTPIGDIEEVRRFSPASYSYDIIKRMLGGIDDLKVLSYAYKRRGVEPVYDRYEKYDRLIGDAGIIGAFGAYSGLGFLISRYMGVANTIYALADHTDVVEETIDLINQVRLQEMRVVAQSPAPIVFFTDNLSSDIHSGPLFDRYMKEFYTRLANLCHTDGKWLCVHVDGRLKGILGRLRECGVDAVDAVTPTPDGDLSLDEAREEAGPDLILWGGVPASIWQESTSDAAFSEYVKKALEFGKRTPRFVIGPSDQLVPGTPKRRLAMMRDLVEECGRYV